jgi:hypothetical protein
MDKGLPFLRIAQGWRNRKENFFWAWILTFCYGVPLLLIRGDDAWNALWCGNLNELGDFLAGFFTPLAFVWLIIGYQLQYREFRLQREEVQLQREELHTTAETLGSQTKLLDEQTTAERRRSMPRLELRADLSSGSVLGQKKFELINFGGPARSLSMELEGLVKERPETIFITCQQDNRNQLRAGESYKFSFSESERDSEYSEYRYTTKCFSERHERFFQRWRIRFSSQGEFFPEPIRELTDGPTPKEAFRKIVTEDYRTTESSRPVSP